MLGDQSHSGKEPFTSLATVTGPLVSSKTEELETSKSFQVNKMLLCSTKPQVVHCGQKSSEQNPKVKAVVQSYSRAPS